MRDSETIPFYRRFLCLVGAFLCFSGLSYGIPLNEWAHPDGCNVDKDLKIISFSVGNYTFDDCVQVNESGWKLLGTPSDNGEILSILDGDSVVSFFKFHINLFKATFTDTEWLSFKNGFASAYGGAIYANSIKGNIANSEFISNTAGTCGGAVYASIAFNGSIRSAVFKNNRATTCGGAMNVGLFISDIANSKFMSNTAKESGGAIYIAQSWLCTASNLNQSAARHNSKGSTLFIGNKAGMFGGAAYVNYSANIYAIFGDMIFQGNMDSLAFNDDFESTKNGANNAVYFKNSDNNKTVTLSAFDGHCMRFYDPISSNVDNPNLTIRINGALAAETAKIQYDPEINGLGTWAARQTGTVLFDSLHSKVYFSNTTVSNGTMALHNGATFGATNNFSINENSTFTLEAGATLRVAYEQERRKYKLENDGSFIEGDISKIEIDYPPYKYAEQRTDGDLVRHLYVSAIDAKKLYLNGKLHFVIPSNIKDGNVLLQPRGVVNFDDKTTHVSLEISEKGFPLEIGQHVVLLHSACSDDELQELGRDTIIVGNCANKTAAAIVKEPLAYGIARKSGYLFDVAIANSSRDLVATVACKIEPEIIANPAMKVLTNSYISGLLLINHSTEITSSLVRNKGVESGKLFFIPFSTDRSTYETGVTSSLRTCALAFAGGLRKCRQVPNGHLCAMGFCDCGIDRYDSANDFEASDFGPAGKTSGKGESRSYSAGAVCRMDYNASSRGHAYWEGSCRAGGLSSDWESAEPVAGGHHADYKISNFVYGGHLAIGYVTGEQSSTNIDFGAKCLWSHRPGSQIKLGEDVVAFDAVDSVRLRLG
ncbi:MAG: hypothetical protein LBC42_01265, partial [Puniceicoccales bacterium]|nr:hypothetical protein [Puniceicoccales bacterium]